MKNTKSLIGSLIVFFYSTSTVLGASELGISPSSLTPTKTLEESLQATAVSAPVPNINEVSTSSLSAPSVPTQTNPNYTVTELPPVLQEGGTLTAIKYEVRNSSGNLIKVLYKELYETNSPTKPRLITALAPPDVSEEGKYLMHATIDSLGSRKVDVYNLITGLLDRTISLGIGADAVTGARFISGTAHILKINYQSSKVDVYDAGSGTKAVATVSNPNYMVISELAQSANWIIYSYHIVDKSGNRLNFINTVGTAATLYKDLYQSGSPQPHQTTAIVAPDISADGKYLTHAYVVSGADRKVSIYSLLTGKIERSIVLGTAADPVTSVGFVAGTSHIMKVNYQSGKVDVYDAATGTKAAATATNANYFVIAESVTVGTAVSNYYYVLTKGGTVLKTFNKDKALAAPDVSQDGTLMMYASTNSAGQRKIETYNTFGIYDSVTKKVLPPALVKTILLTGPVSSVRFMTGTAAVIKVTYATGGVSLFNGKTGEMAASTASNPNYVVLSEVAQTTYYNITNYIVFTKQGVLVKTLTKDLYPSGSSYPHQITSEVTPDVSADGKYISYAYMSPQSGTQTLNIYTLATGAIYKTFSLKPISESKAVKTKFIINPASGALTIQVTYASGAVVTYTV